MHTLLMRLVGSMQSWGHRSRFDNRDTALEPTRSGVIGLLCAALGIPREADLSRFDNLRMGVRVDAPGRVMVDFHTAKRVVRADGTLDKDDTKNTVTSHRYYLADARFLVGLESGDVAFLRELEAALHSPVWPLSLGRKSFCLTAPIWLPDGSVREGVGLEHSLAEFPWYRLREWETKPDRFRRILERTDGNGSIVMLDRPIDFAKRQFAQRRVETDFVPGDRIPDGGVLPCIYPA